MADLKFTGEITDDGGTFTVKVSIAAIPTFADAQEIGKHLHDAVTDFFESHGATLKQSTGIIRPS